MGNPVADKRRPNLGKIVSVRFDEVELERIQRAAARDGLALSALIRAVTLDAVEGDGSLTSIAAAIDTGPQAPSRERMELRVAINRLASNINQLARLGEKGSHSTDPDLDAEVAVDGDASLGMRLLGVQKLLPALSTALRDDELSGSDLREASTVVDQLGGYVNRFARLSNTARELVITSVDDYAGIRQDLWEIQQMLTEVRTLLGGYR